jgi:hypothetical protein
MKAITWPDMDSDGLPSSFAMRIVQNLSKWQVKMHAAEGDLDQAPQNVESVKTLLSCTYVYILLVGAEEGTLREVYGWCYGGIETQGEDQDQGDCRRPGHLCD